MVVFLFFASKPTSLYTCKSKLHKIAHFVSEVILVHLTFALQIDVQDVHQVRSTQSQHRTSIHRLVLLCVLI